MLLRRQPGGGRGVPPPSSVVVRTADGREIRGVRKTKIRFRCRWWTTRAAYTCSISRPSPWQWDVADAVGLLRRITFAAVTNLVAFLSQQKGRDLTKTSAQPIGDGVSFDRLKNGNGEAHKLADVLGQLPGHALLPARPDHRREREDAAVGVGAPVPGTTALEVTPIIVDGVMYVTSGGDPLTVLALDARAGVRSGGTRGHRR